jgi:HEAT repeat protein
MDVDELIRDLKYQKDPVHRAAVAEQIGKLGDARAIPALTEALSDVHMEVKDNAAFALAELGARSVIPDLIRFLKDPSRQLRKTAAKGLGMLRASEAVGPLAALLGDSSYIVRKNAVRSLGQIGGPKAHEALRSYLDSEKETFLREMARRYSTPAEPHRLP